MRARTASHLSAFKVWRRAEADDGDVLAPVRPDDVEVLGGQPTNRGEVVIPGTKEITFPF